MIILSFCSILQYIVHHKLLILCSSLACLNRGIPFYPVILHSYHSPYWNGHNQALYTRFSRTSQYHIKTLIPRTYPHPIGAFQKWGYPKMDGLSWKMPWKMPLNGGSPILGNLHINLNGLIFHAPKIFGSQSSLGRPAPCEEHDIRLFGDDSSYTNHDQNVRL